MALRTCIVTFTTPSGVKHTAEVTAESLFEAAALGVCVISEEWGEEPGLMTEIQIQAKAPATTHEVTLHRLREWVRSASQSPKDKLVKERLKSVLPS